MTDGESVFVTIFAGMAGYGTGGVFDSFLVGLGVFLGLFFLASWVMSDVEDREFFEDDRY